MKQVLLLLLLISCFLTSCRKKTNDPMDILNSSSITMTVEYWGCFAHGIQTLTIKEINGEKTLFFKDDSSNEIMKDKRFIQRLFL